MVSTDLDKQIKSDITSSQEIVIPAELAEDDSIIKNPVLLKDIPTFFVGDTNMQNYKEKRIVIFRAKNQANGDEGFDYLDRKLTFGFHIQILETKDYVTATDLINKIEDALIRTIMNSENLEDFCSEPVIGDIEPYYQTEDDTMEHVIMFTETVTITFEVVEDYEQPEKEFDEFKLNESEVTQDD